MSAPPTIDHLITRLEIDKGDFDRDADAVQKKLGGLAKTIQGEMSKAEQASARATAATRAVENAEDAAGAAKIKRAQVETRQQENLHKLAVVRGRMNRAEGEELKKLKEQKDRLNKDVATDRVAVPTARIRETRTANRHAAAVQELDRAALAAQAAQAAAPALKAQSAEARALQGRLDDKRGERFVYANSTEGRIAAATASKQQSEAVRDGVEKASPVQKEAERNVKRADRRDAIKDAEKKIIDERELAERRAQNQGRYFSGAIGRTRQYFNMSPSESYLNKDHQASGQAMGKVAGKLATKGLRAIGVDAAAAGELGALLGPIGLLVGGVLALGGIIKTSIKYTADLVKSLNTISYRAEESGQNSVTLAAAGQLSEAWGGSAAGAQAAAVNLEHSLYAMRTGGGVSSQLKAMAMYGVHPTDGLGHALDQLDIGRQIARQLANRPGMDKAAKYQAAIAMGQDTGLAHIEAEGPEVFNREAAKMEAETSRMAPAIKNAAEATRAWTEGAQAFSDWWATNKAPLFEWIEKTAGHALSWLYGPKEDKSGGKKPGGTAPGAAPSSHGATMPLGAPLAAGSALSLRGVPSPMPAWVNSQAAQRAAAFQLAASGLRQPPPYPGAGGGPTHDNSLKIEEVHITATHLNNANDLRDSLKQLQARKNGQAQAPGG